VIGVKPNPNWLPFTLSLVDQDHSQLSLLSLAQPLFFEKKNVSRDAKCSLASLAFNAMGINNVILFLARQHQIDALHIMRQRGAVSLSLKLSPVRYVQPLVN
jgi:hypothetical protein